MCFKWWNYNYSNITESKIFKINYKNKNMFYVGKLIIIMACLPQDKERLIIKLWTENSPQLINIEEENNSPYQVHYLLLLWF